MDLTALCGGGEAAGNEPSDRDFGSYVFQYPTRSFILSLTNITRVVFDSTAAFPQPKLTFTLYPRCGY